MKLFPAHDETIHGVGQDLRAGRRTCRQVLEACLARIDELESRVHAWVSIDRDGARTRAIELDADLKAGRWRGPLHGIPIAIKDIVDVAGYPTRAGSSLRVDQAKQDAAVVTRLRTAGAVVLGKTVTTQFASFDPSLTRNPWNLERTPGGSSSGSAAAVACGMCLGAIGSQTGGSITRPASYCGVAGCKPTYRLVSDHGFFPLAPSMDHPGPIARSVRDLALMLDVIADAPPSPSFGQVLDAGSLPAPRLGRLRGLFQQRAELAVLQAFERALETLQAAGAKLSEPPLPASFADVLRCHRVVMATEAAAWHETRLKQHPQDYLPKIRELLEEGLAASATEYIRCRQHQAQLSQEILQCFEDVDALVVPATTDPAPDRATTGDPAFNSPWSYTGFPTVSFPIALTLDGLPLAIQLVGRPFDERRLFVAAHWCENVIRSAHGS